MNTLIAILLILHGLITAAQCGGSFNPTGGVPNPAWLSLWPANLGQSWLLRALGVERLAVARAGGVVWLLAGMALAAAGLGLLGIGVPLAWVRSLALFGAAASLAMFALYLHPFYVIGIGASVVILLAVVMRESPLFERIAL